MAGHSQKIFSGISHGSYKRILSIIEGRDKIVYITGNHDEFLRRYSDTQMGEIWLTDKLLFELDGKNIGFFTEMCSIIRRKVMRNLWLNLAEKVMTSLSC
jgi:hypothetical protein